MTRECSFCEQPASNVMTVEQGTSWADTCGLPPHTFFERYTAVHPVQTQFGDHKVYLHTEEDFQDGR